MFIRKCSTEVYPGSFIYLHVTATPFLPRSDVHVKIGRDKVMLSVGNNGLWFPLFMRVYYGFSINLHSPGHLHISMICSKGAIAAYPGPWQYYICGTCLSHVSYLSLYAVTEGAFRKHMRNLIREKLARSLAQLDWYL